MTKILIIDDNFDVRRMVERRLRAAGYDTKSLSSGRAAYTCCEEFYPDIILTDIYMSEMDGLEILRKLKPAFPQITFFAMSGGSIQYGQEYLDVARAFGAKFIFKKPIEWPALLEAIKAVSIEDKSSDSPIRNNTQSIDTKEVVFHA